MRPVKLSIVLPALQCGLQGVLYYWGRHSLPTVRSYLGGVTPSVPITMGLNPIAVLLSTLTSESLGRLGAAHQPVLTPHLVAMAHFLFFVAATWYLIGYWLDHRSVLRKAREVPGYVRPWIAGGQLAVLVFGLLILLFSLHVHTLHFVEVIERALLQTWAAFLIGVPFLGLMGPAVQNSVSARLPFRYISNFRGFMIALGLFSALLAFWVLISR